MTFEWLTWIISPLWFDRLSLLIDTYWMFILGALVLGVIVGWIAARNDDISTNQNG